MKMQNDYSLYSPGFGALITKNSGVYFIFDFHPWLRKAVKKRYNKNVIKSEVKDGRSYI